MIVVRVATWNLQGRTGDAARRLGSLLAEVGGADVVLLQESAPSGLDGFVEAAGLDWGVNVRDRFHDLLRARGRAGGVGSDGTRSQSGRPVAIAGRGEPVRGLTAFPDAPLPEKVVAGWVDVAGSRTTVVSYHAPAGVTHGVLKPRQAVQVARWLASLDGPVILGGDFNTPLLDPPQDADVRTHYHTGYVDLDGEPGDDVLLGPQPVHSLRDAFRSYLSTHPDELAAISAERPNGPLAVSHRTGNRVDQAMRYDAIWLSPHFEVRSVHHLYDEAINAGTDHGLVIADVTLRRDAEAA